MAAKILLVDSDNAFAMMLEEMLETDGGYQVEVAQSERQALELLRRGDFALTIVDMGLAPGEKAYLGLIQKVRQGWPGMRLVLIPFMGSDLPEEARRLDVQGTLSKPFFVDDLLPAIREALTRPVRSPGRAEAPAAPAQATAAAGAPSARPARSEALAGSGLQAMLAALLRETGADTALYISSAAGREELLGHASALPALKGGSGSRRAAEALVGPIVAAVRAAQMAGHALGETDAPFEHNMFESATARLYVLAVPGDRLLAVVTPIGTPLGTIRTNLRRAVREMGGEHR